MNKTKAIIVTIIIALMLALIDFGLFQLWFPGFVALTGALAIIGFVAGFYFFGLWLSEPPVSDRQDDQNDELMKLLAPHTKMYDWSKDTDPLPADQAEPDTPVTQEDGAFTLGEIMDEYREEPEGEAEA